MTQEIGHNSKRAKAGGIAADQLRSIVERVERLTEEKAALAADIRDVFAEAKGNGFNLTATGAGGTYAPSATANSTNTNANLNSNSSRSSSESSARQRQTQSATSGVSGSGNSSVTIKDRKQAPAVFAPGLVAGFDCLGSATLGGSIAGIGGALGSTSANIDCLRMRYSDRAALKGKHKASLALLCMNEEFRQAMKLEEEGCPDLPGESIYREEGHNEYPSGGSANDRRYQ
jgi:hypothetical protein